MHRTHSLVHSIDVRYFPTIDQIKYGVFLMNRDVVSQVWLEMFGEVLNNEL